LEFFFNISGTAEASDFKFGMLLGFAKGHHKITPIGKVGLALGYGISPKLGFSFNISATTEDSDFQIARLVEFAKSHHKIPPRRKRGLGSGLGELPKFGVFHLIFMQCAMTESIDFKFGTQSGWPIRLISRSHK